MNPTKKIHCDTCQDTGEVEGATCSACCDHEWDWSEGGMCLNCDSEGDMGAMIDGADWAYNDR
jgi:hypothetical protein